MKSTPDTKVAPLGSERFVYSLTSLPDIVFASKTNAQKIRVPTFSRDDEDEHGKGFPSNQT